MGIFLLIIVSFEGDRKQHYEKICEFHGGGGLDCCYPYF